MKTLRTGLAIIFILVMGFTKSACAQKRTITVAVAANVQYAMQDLKTEFEKETGIKTTVIIGSSGQLTAQIQQGAPYDIFISADMKYPNTLYKNHLAVEAPKIYAFGTLVLWSMKDEIDFRNDFKELIDPSIQKIALANPRTAPYGVAAIQALKYYNKYDQVRDKLVYGESISPTNQYIVSKAVDIGFTAKSVVMSPVMKGKGTWKEVNPKAYKPIEQGCVILKYGLEHHKIESESFYRFIFSKKAQSILVEYGYKVN